MPLLLDKNPRDDGEHLELDGVNPHDRCLYLALEDDVSTKVAIEMLKNDYGIETTRDTLVEENIDRILETVNDILEPRSRVVQKHVAITTST